MATNPMTMGDPGFDPQRAFDGHYGAAVGPVAEREDAERIAEQMRQVVETMRERLKEAANGRQTIEARWREDLLQYHGRYDQRIQGMLDSDPARSTVFINMTRPKTDSWEARIGDLLFPTDEKNWGINPTPVPELTEAARKAVADAEEAAKTAARKVEEAAEAAEDGAKAETEDAQAEAAARQEQASAAANEAMGAVEEARAIERRARLVMDEAQRRCDQMEREIDDQLTECRYPSQARDALGHAVRLGSGVLKGPVTADRPARRWVRRASQVEGVEMPFTLDMTRQFAPEARSVDPWNFYPDPTAATIDDAAYTFERHLKNPAQLRRMAKQHGFHPNTIRTVLRDEWRPIDEIDTVFIDAIRAMSASGAAAKDDVSRLFSVWEYHGPLTVKEIAAVLRATGKAEQAMEVEMADDPLDERMVVAYFVGDMMLKLAPDYPMDSDEKLYSVMSFAKAEHRVLGGEGVPRLMRAEQAMLNGAVRMMMDNGGLSVAPQVLVDKSRIEPEDGSWTPAPRKVWRLKSDVASSPGQRPPLEVFSIPMNQPQMIAIIDLALRFIDMVISMPQLAQGEQGQASNTMGGMSMLFNSANVVFRRVVKVWDDDVTEPLIRRFFDWNMQFSSKEEIKGDMKVEARGTSVLLVREIQAQQLLQIAMSWSTHPVLATAVRAYEAARLTLQALAINPDQVLKPLDEFERDIQAAAEAASQQQPPEVIRAQAAVEAAKIGAQASDTDAATRLQIAELNRDIAIMDLMTKKEIGAAEIAANVEKARMAMESKERTLAVEVAIEQKAASDAQARGMAPTGSGGAISMGAERLS